MRSSFVARMWTVFLFGSSFFQSQALAYGVIEPSKLFTIDSFRDFKSEHGLTSIEKLIPLIPPEMRKNVVVVFKSQSLQEASCKNPRVLLFDSKAQLTISFNGEASQYGYEAIEMQEFDSVESRFLYFEEPFSEDVDARIKFLRSNQSQANNNGTSPQQVEDEIQMILKRTNRVGKNPPLCLACHKSDPRPNLESYSSWPGFMGEEDDQIYNDNSQFSGFGSSMGKQRDGKSYLECVGEFASNYKKNDRYKYLDLENQLNRDAYNRNGLLAKYTQLVFNQNFRRINRIIESHGEHSLIKRIVVSYLWNCRPEQALGISSEYTALDRMSGEQLAYDTSEPEPRAAIGAGAAGGLEPLLKPFGFLLDQFYTMFFYNKGANFRTQGAAAAELTRVLIENEPNLIPMFELEERKQYPSDPTARPIDYNSFCKKINLEIQNLSQKIKN